MPVKKVTVRRVAIRDNAPQLGWCVRVTFSDRQNIYVDIGDKAKVDAIGAALYAATKKPRTQARGNENV